MIYNYSSYGYPNTFAYKAKKDTYSQKNMYLNRAFPVPTSRPYMKNSKLHPYSYEKSHQDEIPNLSSIPKKIPKNIPSKSDSALFEFFGIKLYFDDILLICLIFFLYNEGVKDEYLFIVLVLLLLS